MWVEREVLIIVKAYPNLSSVYRETSCTAAISKEDGWLRLYPIRFRSLPRDKRFKKYQIVQLRMTPHNQDGRPESFRPDEDSLKPGRVLGTENAWAERKEWVLPVVSQSMCEIIAKQKQNKKSLSAFKPRKVTDLKIKYVGSEYKGKQKAKVMQMWFDDLRGHSRVEKIPYEFRYRYTCEEEGCKGHEQRIIDWELMQLYRNLKSKGYRTEEIEDKIRSKYLDNLCGPDKETYFFVGNHSRFRNSFMVLGVFWPPKQVPGLFALD